MAKERGRRCSADDMADRLVGKLAKLTDTQIAAALVPVLERLGALEQRVAE